MSLASESYHDFACHQPPCRHLLKNIWMGSEANLGDCRVKSFGCKAQMPEKGIEPHIFSAIDPTNIWKFEFQNQLSLCVTNIQDLTIDIHKM